MRGERVHTSWGSGVSWEDRGFGAYPGSVYTSFVLITTKHVTPNWGIHRNCEMFNDTKRVVYTESLLI